LCLNGSQEKNKSGCAVMLLQYVYRRHVLYNSSSSQWKWGLHSTLKLDKQRGRRGRRRGWVWYDNL